MLNSKQPEKIRVSTGSAAVLGLKRLKMDTPPTTCYLMTYTEEYCLGKCSFCPQGHTPTLQSTEQLSRIQWPDFNWEDFIQQLKVNQSHESDNKFRRICIQVLNYKGFYDDVRSIVKIIHMHFPTLAISAAIPPVPPIKLKELKDSGLERIGIALDACYEELFDDIKGKNIHGPYSWKKHWEALSSSLKIFGLGKATTHFIVGLGETEQDMIQSIKNVVEKDILPGIFLFTPVKGTPMENAPRPLMTHFRHIQLCRYLLLNNIDNYDRFRFSNDGRLSKIKSLTKDELTHIIQLNTAFKTAGCPDCNRPYYTSRPGEEQDGYPRDLTTQECLLIYNELDSLLDI
ncbi:radical SAM protein [Candidatus Lokiarchaeum ossiferum]|uniref:radical SAM protein n=1 Tax=Candidatus Lokiarchaeum ossiferum TaxID=2951803 RepID=UPI00352E3EFC